MGWGVGARLLLCGQPITITGGHTWHFGGEADGVEGVRRKAREMVRLGADFIKVMGSGGGTRGRHWEFSVGWSCTDTVMGAIGRVPNGAWQAGIDQVGKVVDDTFVSRPDRSARPG